MEWDGQFVKRKKAKQKHRNSASVAGQPDRRSSVPGDWKDAISGFGEDSIWTLSITEFQSGSQHSAEAFPFSSSRMWRAGSSGGPGPSFFIGKMKQRREKGRNRETRPPWPDRERINPIGHVSRSFARGSALFPKVLVPYTHTSSRNVRWWGTQKNKETINRETRLTAAGPLLWCAAIRWKLVVLHVDFKVFYRHVGLGGNHRRRSLPRG